MTAVEAENDRLRREALAQLETLNGQLARLATLRPHAALQVLAATERELRSQLCGLPFDVAFGVAQRPGRT